MSENCAELTMTTINQQITPLDGTFPLQLPQMPIITSNDGEQLQQQHHHLLMANLWNNLLLGQHRLRDLAAAERVLKTNEEQQTAANEQAEMAVTIKPKIPEKP